MNLDDRITTKLFWFALLSGFCAANDEAFETCNRYTSFGYGYRDFFEFRGGNLSGNQVFYLEFYVRTGSDAHVLLKPEEETERGYEIVIGGGSNTFSQIRLVQPELKKTVITQKTENFLSDEEYREFWISMDRLGIISVGKKEKDEVFINWRFDDPLPLKLFSFGSWTNMKADWRFGCKAPNDVIHEERLLPPLTRLKRDLLSLYDPNALPVDKRANLVVNINFLIHNVLLDAKRGELTMYGIGDLKWEDKKLRWKPENYDGITNVYLPPFQIWTPSIKVLNALASERASLLDLTAAAVVAKYDGSIFWRPPFKSVSHCVVSLNHWPYDVHNCTVLFGFWMEPSNLVLSVMNEYNTMVEERTESEWKVMEVIPFNTNHIGEEENYGILYVELKRSNGASAVILLMPYIGGILMCTCCFWVPLHSPSKLHLSCGSVLCMLTALFLAGQSVPAMTNTVPRIVHLYSWSVVVTSTVVLLFVILKNVGPSLFVPDCISKILSNSVFGHIFCLPELDEMSKQYSNFNEEVNKVNKCRWNALRLTTFVERLFFLFYLIAMALLYFLI